MVIAIESFLSTHAKTECLDYNSECPDYNYFLDIDYDCPEYFYDECVIKFNSQET